MFQVRSSESMNTGDAPRKVAGLTLPIKVWVEAKTSSPGPTPSSRKAKCMAAVPLARATPLGTSAADLRDASAKLAEALAAAGVPLLGFKVKFENEYPAGQG